MEKNCLKNIVVLLNNVRLFFNEKNRGVNLKY